MAQVIIVSNRLPVSVKKTDGHLEFFESTGGLATGLSSYVKDKNTTWIGWPGIAADELTEADKQTISAELLKHKCSPVFLTKRQLDDFYSGYSNSILWPLFHNLPLRIGTHHEQWWNAYRNVNKLFAEAVSTIARAQTTIWVHDYQLMLLPELLRSENPYRHVGFFLHIPFPDVKTFAKLSESKKLLSGMLGAELIGFHTTGYVTNFMLNTTVLTRAVVSDSQITIKDRIIRVSNFPMGIDYQKYAAASKTTAVKRAVKKYRQRYRGKKLIVSVDRLDPSKGLVERLKAYQAFLEANPRQVGKVILSMVAAPSRTDVAAYKSLSIKLNQLVTDINLKYSTRRWQAIDYIDRSLPFEEVTALYQLADVAFITPLRDGMNLVAKEFVATAHNNGVLILSETAGAAEELADALIVNPEQPDTVVKALQQALTMPRKELRSRLKRMQKQLSSNTVQVWANGFMKTLNSPVRSPTARTRNLKPTLSRQIIADYRLAKKRLLLLDYDGTLVPFSQDFKAARPSKKVVEILKELAADTANTVVLISGRAQADLDEWFNELKINLVAEHGAYVKRHDRKTWTGLASSEAVWMDKIRPILERYATKTPLSVMEEKKHSLVWHYRRSPAYSSQKYSVVIKRVLTPILKSYGLEIFNGNKMLEIKDPKINKGSALAIWLGNDYDFMLSIGDDLTDEDMFSVLPATAYSLKVGTGKTRARYRIQSPERVINLLRSMPKK